MLDIDTNGGNFKLLSVIYFKICALWLVIFSRKISASLCFLDGFGIAVQVFSD